MTVINDILDFSKIEAGRLLTSHPGPFRLHEVLAETLKMLALCGPQKGSWS